MKTKTLILTILTVALLLSTVALPVAAVVGAYNHSLGDLNVDGKVNSIDCMILKRYVLKTYSLRDSLLYSADLNLDGEVNTVDYMVLRKMVLGTYTLDLSWTRKPYSEMTDEELKRAIRYSLVLMHEEDQLFIKFEAGIGEEEARAMLEELPFYAQFIKMEFFGSSQLCYLWVETSELQEMMFAIARLKGVEGVDPGYLLLPN